MLDRFDDQAPARAGQDAASGADAGDAGNADNAGSALRLGIPTIYYLLRARNCVAGSGAYVGLAPRGAHAIVAQPLQARRFASIDDARVYVTTTGRGFGEFDIEARMTE